MIPCQQGYTCSISDLCQFLKKQNAMVTTSTYSFMSFQNTTAKCSVNCFQSEIH